MPYRKLRASYELPPSVHILRHLYINAHSTAYGTAVLVLCPVFLVLIVQFACSPLTFLKGRGDGAATIVRVIPFFVS